MSPNVATKSPRAELNSNIPSEKEPLRPAQVELQHPVQVPGGQSHAKPTEPVVPAVSIQDNRAVQEAALLREKEAAMRLAQEEADRKAKLAADETAALAKKAKDEADKQAKELADRKAKEEADLAAKKADADRKLKEETDRKLKEEADRKLKEESDRRAKEEADKKLKEEADKKAKEEADKKAKEEADRKAKEEEEKKKASLPKLPFNLKKLLDAFNDIRVNPSKYAEVIQTRYINDLDKSGVLKSKRIKTNEGLPVFKEAKAFLEKAKGLPPLELDYGLVAAAYLHSDWMSETDNLDHTGRNKSDVKKRMEQFGKVDPYGMQGGAENILFTYSYDPVEFILDFVIDDGVPDRGHRDNVFQKTATTVGFGVRPPGDRKHRRWYFTIDIGWPSYHSDKSLISGKVMEESGLKEYEMDSGK